MIKHTQDLASIDPQRLDDVAGGAGPAPFQQTPVQQPLLLPKPFTPPPQGGPKYSAAWWDLVRARGIFK
jgi:hypothetical protein